MTVIVKVNINKFTNNNIFCLVLFDNVPRDRPKRETTSEYSNTVVQKKADRFVDFEKFFDGNTRVLFLNKLYLRT